MTNSNKKTPSKGTADAAWLRELSSKVNAPLEALRISQSVKDLMEQTMMRQASWQEDLVRKAAYSPPPAWESLSSMNKWAEAAIRPWQTDILKSTYLTAGEVVRGPATEMFSRLTSVGSAVQQYENQIEAARLRAIAGAQISTGVSAHSVMSQYENYFNGGAAHAAAGALISANAFEHIKAAMGSADSFDRLTSANSFLKQYEDRFRVPPISEANSIAACLGDNKGALARYAEKLGLAGDRDHLKVLSSLHSPWMNINDASQSVRGLAELHSLSSMLRTVDAFDTRLTVAIREDLGDWRKASSVPAAVVTDPGARTAYYLEQGFNPVITDVPEKAFQETVITTGFADNLDHLLAMPPLMRDSNRHEGEGFRRTNRCHDYLQRFENRIRTFIHHVMTDQYGPEWVNRIDKEIREDWERKKAKAESAGYSFTVLIEAADFTHYERIICNRGLWRDVFQKYFGGESSSVRESLMRLLPVRLATMHSRFVTPEDLLYVLSECTRLARSIS